MAAAAPVSALRDTVAAANGIQAAAPMSPSVHDSQGGAAAPGLDSTAEWTPRKPPKFLAEAFLSPNPMDTPFNAQVVQPASWQLGTTPTAGNRSVAKLNSQPHDPRARLRALARTLPILPAIYQHGNKRSHEIAADLGVNVADWPAVYKLRAASGAHRRLISEPVVEKRPENGAEPSLTSRQSVQKVSKVVKAKGHTNGRTFTSKYRGVHQTFPTKRWEAQFRRNGKPTSLGCFDHEVEASRAYDKMILWVDLHSANPGSKTGITNFDKSEYEPEMTYLQSVSQDDLVSALRSEGRRQAAKRMMRHKRDPHKDPDSGSD